MSRCFPYPPPPPYYEEGLIESIKKESERAKKERRKEKKREKKEKREKAGQEHEESKRSKHSRKKRKYDERSQLNQKDGYNAKAKAAAGVVEQLEGSGLTEEHEQPNSIQNIYDSSESSQDSSKRRKLVAPNVNQNSHGSILRIRLPLIKQKDATLPANIPVVKEKNPTPPASMPILKQKDPVPPATMPVVKQKNLKPPATMPVVKQKDLKPPVTMPAAKQKDPVPPATMPMVKQKDLKPPATVPAAKQKDPVPPATMPVVKQKDRKPPATVPTLNQTDSELSRTRTSEEPCFSGRVTETALEMEAAKSPYSKSSSKRNRRIHEMEGQFGELIMNWNPPPLQLEHSDISDQDWLFGCSKRRSSLNSNMHEAHKEGLLSHGSSVPSSMQPQACFLPGFDTYQLPYVIPY